MLRVMLAIALLVLFGGCNGAPDENASGQMEPEPAAGPRSAAVAGAFYPADPGALRQMVDAFLAEGREGSPPGGGRPLAIVAPHAGYVYSGLTAGYAYAAVKGSSYDTVLLLGSPHVVPVRGAAVYCGPGFDTPLGVAEVDVALAEAVVRASPVAEDLREPHAREHSLEVQLPFLSAALGSFRFVPILLMGDRALLDAAAGAIHSALLGAYGPDVRPLIVVSTDLAHYPEKSDAERSDREILEAFCSLDPERLLETDRRLMGENVSNMLCTMCAIDASYVALRLLERLGGKEAVILHHSVSSDSTFVSASPDRVVGYGAVAVYAAGDESAQGGGDDMSRENGGSIRTYEPLSEAEQRFLLECARSTLESFCEDRTVPEFHPPSGSRNLLEKRGVFVTLRRESELRGCIGRHSADLPLYRMVPKMAVASGFQDPRFPPLKNRELDRIEIEISVYLSDVVRIPGPSAFQVGKHGIILHKGAYGSTFLPHVAGEQGWDRETTLRHLCLKAGLPADAWRGGDVEFSVYETQIFSER